jgi:hypothetical protein
MDNLEEEIDTTVCLLINVKKNIKKYNIEREKEKCESAFKKYNKGMSLYENIKKLQKDFDNLNEQYFSVNTKLFDMQRKYEGKRGED